MGLINEDVNLAEFEEALRAITEPILGKTLEQINVSTLLLKLLQTARRFEMTLQPDLLLLQKSMVIIDGVGRQLYPDINMWEVAKPLVFKWMLRERFSPGSVMGKGRESLAELTGAAYDIPINMNKVLSKTSRDDLKIGFVHHGLEPVVDGIGMAGRRIAGAFVAGALIVAASVMAARSSDQAVFLGLPILSWGALVIAFVIGVKSLGSGR
jgi:ubiquinone biosynthesis protein